MELYDPVQGNWTLTGPMVQSRLGHTATLLPNGQVLLVGGLTNWIPLSPVASAELYDPLSGTNTTIASMNSARFDHTATLLPNGTLLVAGGLGPTNAYPINGAEIYDPSAGTWSLTNALLTARFLHTATLLPNGQILVAGGGTDAAQFSGLSSTELYDSTVAPSAGSWTFTGSMQTARSSFTMTLLPTGKVLVAGGQNNGSGYATCELFNPVTGTWTNTDSMNFARFHHTATLLPNGKVLVVGGSINTLVPELYDPATGTWTTNGVMYGVSYANTATLLRNGKVLLAGAGLGQHGTNSAELYDWTTDTWVVTGDMITPRIWHKAVLLPNGKVLVVGGSLSASFTSAELYDPLTGQWTSAGQTREASYDFTAAALLPNGKVLVAGMGTNGLPSAEQFDPASVTWTTNQPSNAAHFLPTFTLLPSGKVLLVGEGAASEIYDPATGQWSTTASMNVDRQDDRAVLLPDGRVLDAGGDASIGNILGPTSSAEMYIVGSGCTNSWQPQITLATSPLNLGTPLTITGSGFRGIAEGSSGNSQDSPGDYPLVQLRSIENGQMTFLLTTDWSTNSFTSLPIWNFPPGYALATVFVNGIQSTSSIVNISVPIPGMTTLTGAQTSTNGFQFAFTNNPGALLGVLAATNLSLPLSNWTALSGVTEVSPGQFQFNDPQATNGGQNFYRLFAP
jgi:hypothetical protein